MSTLASKTINSCCYSETRLFSLLILHYFFSGNKIHKCIYVCILLKYKVGCCNSASFIETDTHASSEATCLLFSLILSSCSQLLLWNQSCALLLDVKASEWKSGTCTRTRAFQSTPIKTGLWNNLLELVIPPSNHIYNSASSISLRLINMMKRSCHVAVAKGTLQKATSNKSCRKNLLTNLNTLTVLLCRKAKLLAGIKNAPVQLTLSVLSFLKYSTETYHLVHFHC